jgi:hypothetical protein
LEPQSEGQLPLVSPQLCSQKKFPQAQGLAQSLEHESGVSPHWESQAPSPHWHTGGAQSFRHVMGSSPQAGLQTPSPQEQAITQSCGQLPLVSPQPA